MNIGVTIFPPIYEVEDILNLFTPYFEGSYTTKYKPSMNEDKTLSYIYEEGILSIVKCMNPNRLSSFSTKDCIVVLHNVVDNLDLVTENGGIGFTLEDYISNIQQSYNTILNVLPILNRVESHLWLETINKHLLMVLRMDNKELWEFVHQNVVSPYTGNTEYLFDFTKSFNIDDNTYYASLGIHLEHTEESGMEVEKLYTCTSEKEIIETKGQCLKVNYNQKRFLQYLSDLNESQYNVSDVLQLEGYCKKLMNQVKFINTQTAIIR